MLSHIAKALPKLPCPATLTPNILRSRIALYFGTGVVVSSLAFFADLFIFTRHTHAEISWFYPYYNQMFLVHPISFFLGILLIYARDWSQRALLGIDFVIVAINLLMVTFSYSVFSPTAPALFAYSLILFVHAALVPCSVWQQFFIAITAAAAYPLGQALAFYFLPEIREFCFDLTGGKPIGGMVLSRSTDVAILAGVSVLITRTLYSYRENLREAHRLGNYLIKGELGTGGMGKVYEASHTFLRRPTAIKVLEPKGADVKSAVARFEQEVQLSSTLTHPNTITIFDYGHCAHNTFYYSMELLDGMDLQKLVEKHGPLPVNRAIYILTQVCGSLGEAHSRGIIHRDIKPSNIFLSIRGGIHDFVKVLDFGLAKQIRMDTGSNITQAGAFLGTPRYIAPETVYGKGRIDHRTDIYMLGSVAYWILTGRPPFDAVTSAELIVDHVKTIPPYPSDVTENPIPKDLDQIVMKCLEKLQEDRYQSVLELRQALEAVTLQEEWNPEKARDWWELHAEVKEAPISVKPESEVSYVYEPVKAIPELKLNMR